MRTLQRRFISPTLNKDIVPGSFTLLQKQVANQIAGLETALSMFSELGR